MALLTHELRASYAFIERNFFLTRRYWGWELAFLVYSVAGALSISLIGAAAQDDRLLLTLMIGAIFLELPERGVRLQPRRGQGQRHRLHHLPPPGSGGAERP